MLANKKMILARNKMIRTRYMKILAQLFSMLTIIIKICLRNKMMHIRNITIIMCFIMMGKRENMKPPATRAGQRGLNE